MNIRMHHAFSKRGGGGLVKRGEAITFHTHFLVRTPCLLGFPQTLHQLVGKSHRKSDVFNRIEHFAGKVQLDG